MLPGEDPFSPAALTGSVKEVLKGNKEWVAPKDRAALERALEVKTTLENQRILAAGQRKVFSRKIDQVSYDFIKLLREPGTLELLTQEEKARIPFILDAVGVKAQQGMFDTLYPDTGPRRRALYEPHIWFFEAGATCPERLFQAGNRCGKTTCGTYEMACHLTGNYPDWWPGYKFNEPTSCWSCGKENSTLWEVNQKMLFGGTRKQAGKKYRLLGTGMIPGDAIMHETTRFKQGFPGLLDNVEIRYRDSRYEFSSLGLRSYAQGRKVFEGSEKHGVHADEEPPADVYGEIVMRTATVNGRVFVTFTPLDGMTDVVMSFQPKEERIGTVFDAFEPGAYEI